MCEPFQLSCSEKEAEQLFLHGRVEVRRPEHRVGPLFPGAGALVGICEPWVIWRAGRQTRFFLPIPPHGRCRRRRCGSGGELLKSGGRAARLSSCCTEKRGAFDVK